MTTDDNDNTLKGDNAQDGDGGSLAETENRTDEPETPICPHCMEMLGPHDHMCPHCGAPLDMNATFAFDETLTEGWLWRSAANKPISWIVVLGMWLIMLPPFFICFLFAESAFQAGIDLNKNRYAPAEPIWGIVGYSLVGLGVLACAGAASVYGSIILKVTRNYFRQKSRLTMNYDAIDNLADERREASLD